MQIIIIPTIIDVFLKLICTLLFEINTNVNAIAAILRS